MSDDINRLRDDVKDLYNARNDHEKRISVVETNIGYIREEQTQIRQQIKDNHVEYMGAVGMIQGTIDKFIKDINGVPKRNAEEIVGIKSDVKSVKNCVEGLNQAKWSVGGAWKAILFIGSLIMGLFGILTFIFKFLL